MIRVEDFVQLKENKSEWKRIWGTEMGFNELEKPKKHKITDFPWIILKN